MTPTTLAQATKQLLALDTQVQALTREVVALDTQACMLAHIEALGQVSDALGRAVDAAGKRADEALEAYKRNRGYKQAAELWQASEQAYAEWDAAYARYTQACKRRREAWAAYKRKYK